MSTPNQQKTFEAILDTLGGFKDRIDEIHTRQGEHSRRLQTIEQNQAVHEKDDEGRFKLLELSQDQHMANQEQLRLEVRNGLADLKALIQAERAEVRVWWREMTAPLVSGLVVGSVLLIAQLLFKVHL